MDQDINSEEIIEEPKKAPNFILYIWINGKPVSDAFILRIYNPANYDYKSLKLAILYQRNLPEELVDKIVLYNQRGIEIDDVDVASLNNGDLLYLSPIEEKFSDKNFENEYEIVKYIKKGGFGEIFLAKHVLTNKIFAIKKTNLENFCLNSLYTITRESFLLDTFKHKNIIKIYNSYLTNNSLYIVMEYAKGGELFSVIKEGGLNEFQCKFYFMQIYSAIQYIHSKNVIHRDLKPNNILFLDEEKTKLVLIDFGISGVSNGNNHDVIKAGTIRYMPPEMCDENNFSSNVKIDMWALGIILYLLFYGKFPFDGKNLDQIIERIINQPLVIPKNKKISETLYKLIVGLLQKNPEKRIDTSSDLFENWFSDELLTPHKFTKTRHLSLFNKILHGDQLSLPLVTENYKNKKINLKKSFDQENFDKKIEDKNIVKYKIKTNSSNILKLNASESGNTSGLHIKKTFTMNGKNLKTNNKLFIKLKKHSKERETEKLILPKIILNNNETSRRYRNMVESKK